MRIREYERRDAPAIVWLFYETVHSVNSADYSEQELRVWAPKVPDPELWHSRMSQCWTLVAEQDGEIIGFAELEYDGHLDMFYCRKDVIGRGVGRSLYEAVESKAIGLKLDRIFAEVSITARRFFERQGFSVLLKRAVIREGTEIRNFRMEKRLPQ